MDKRVGTYGSNGYNASKGGDGTILYDYKEIIQLANLGYTSDQIERKIGCCKSTIYKVLKSHNCKLRKSNCKLIDNSNSMNQIDSKTAIQYVVEAYEAGMDKAKELIKDSGEL